MLYFFAQQAERAKEIGKAFKTYKENAPFDYRLLVIFVGSAVILLLSIWLFRRVRRTTVSNAPPLSVFDKAAADLGLTIMDRWLLVRIAKQQKLETPLTLLVSAQTLVHHANSFIKAQPRWRRDSVAQRVNRMSSKLFDTAKAA